MCGVSTLGIECFASGVHNVVRALCGADSVRVVLVV